jgi:aminoglycoside phosphotransferase (APT) family kinase protein
MPVPTMGPGEVGIDESLVGRLIARQFPRWAGLPLVRVRSAGTDNAIYRLGDDMAVRLPRHPGAAGAVDKEQQWLARLAPMLPLAIPLPLGKGVPGEGYPYWWSVYRWLAGETLADQPGVDLNHAAVQLGRFVAALQRVDPAAGPPSFRGGPVSSLDDRVRAEIGDLGRDGIIDAGLASAAWESALAAPAWDGPPVLLHADLHPANLLAHRGRLTAVIDFGGLGTGDPACDLLPAWALLTAEPRELFRAETGADDATWVRGRGWGLGLGLGAVHFYQVINPVLAAIGRHSIAEAIADYQRAA